MVIFRSSQPELYQKVDYIDAKVDVIDKQVTAHLARYEEQIRGIQNQLREQNSIGKDQHLENQLAIKAIREENQVIREENKRANRMQLITMLSLCAAARFIPPEVFGDVLRIFHG